MKKIRTIPLLVAVLAAGLTACELSNPAPAPTACLEIARKEGAGLVPVTEAKVNQEIVFRSCSAADFLVVWPGDVAGNYFAKTYVDPKDAPRPDGTPNVRYGKGLAFNNTVGQTLYKYAKPGTYTVVLLATNVGDDLEGKQSMTTTELVITE